LVRYVKILETCTNFRDLKWGIDFSLGSKIGESQILDGNRVKVSRFGPHTPTFGE